MKNAIVQAQVLNEIARFTCIARAHGLHIKAERTPKAVLSRDALAQHRLRAGIMKLQVERRRRSPSCREGAPWRGPWSSGSRGDEMQPSSTRQLRYGV